MDTNTQSTTKTVSTKILVLFAIIILLIVTLITTTFLLLCNSFKSDKNTIFKTTYLSYGKSSISISNLSKEKLAKTIQAAKEEYLSTYITFKSDKLNIKNSLKDVGVKLDIKNLSKCIKNNTYSDSFFKYIPQKINCSHTTINLEDYISLDKKLFLNFASKNLKKANIPALNANLKIVNGKFLVTNSANGKSFNSSLLFKRLLNDIKDKKFIEVLQTQTIKPSLTVDNAKNMLPTNFLSSYTTYYGSSTYARKTNIGIAASKINNYILPPNGTFEFYNTIGGEPTYNMGYMSAPMYVNGQVVPGVGGGMCQVATTLYNAVLSADIKILERYNHALPVHYAPLGLDAAVAYGCNTLRFKNNTKGFLLIKSAFDGANLTFSIYGHEKLKNRISISAYNVGYNSAVAYRYVYNTNGSLIRKDFLGQSTYK